MKINIWIRNLSYSDLIGSYLVVNTVCFLLGIIVFFFPIMPICFMFDIEFSNLGPIATATYALIFDTFIVTPIYIVILIVKIIISLNSKLHMSNINE
jgi:hypothetical protein